MATEAGRPVGARTGPRSRTGRGPARARGGSGGAGGETHRDSEATNGSRRSILTALLAEALGTFALTTVAAGGEMVFRMGLPDGPDLVARAVAPGMLVAAFIYALGDASGAHFNPAVTLAFASKALFPWRRVPAYWLSQLAGAIVATLVLRTILGNGGDLGATIPHVSGVAAVAIEVILTWTLVTVILGTADRARLIGPNAALAVGATIALCGLWAGPLEGASMNPARSLGPAIVAADLADAWIYVLGPLIGALAAVVTTAVLHGTRQHDPKQREAAQGGQAMNGGSQEGLDGRGRRGGLLQPLSAAGTSPSRRRARPEAGD